MAQLQNENASAYKDLSKEMKAYMDYICDTLLKTNDRNPDVRQDRSRR